MAIVQRPKRGEIANMPHTIVTDVCEGVADCVDACPVACIHEGPGKMLKEQIGTGLIFLLVLIVASVYKYAL